MIESKAIAHLIENLHSMPRVQGFTLTFNKLHAVNTCSLALEKWRLEDQKLHIILGERESSGKAWSIPYLV